MPAIDYKAIKEKIREILQNSTELAGLDVVIGLSNDLNLLTPTANIDLLRRTAPEAQSMSAGTRTRYHIDATIIVMCASIEDGVAERQRDDYIGTIETILLANRKLENLVSTLMLNGGELITGFDKDAGYYVAGGEINFTIDATLTI